MPSRAVEREIIDLEHESWKALQKSGKALFPFMAKDCCMIFPGGTIFSTDSNPTLAEILTRDGKAFSIPIPSAIPLTFVPSPKHQSPASRRFVCV